MEDRLYVREAHEVAGRWRSCVVRGDVHAITLPRKRRHVQGGRRYAVIVQADDLLALSTVVICPPPAQLSQPASTPISCCSINRPGSLRDGWPRRRSRPRRAKRTSPCRSSAPSRTPSSSCSTYPESPPRSKAPLVRTKAKRRRPIVRLLSASRSQERPTIVGDGGGGIRTLGPGVAPDQQLSRLPHSTALPPLQDDET